MLLSIILLLILAVLLYIGTSIMGLWLGLLYFCCACACGIFVFLGFCTVKEALDNGNDFDELP